MKTRNLSQWNQTVAFIAWAAFATSFFLRSYGDAPGYICAVMHGMFWSAAMHGNWASIHYLLLTLPNLMMLASPFLMFRLGKYARGLSWLRYSTFAALILVWSFVIRLLISKNGSDLRVGAFIWAASFLILWASAILPHKRLVQTGDLNQGTSIA